MNMRKKLIISALLLSSCVAAHADFDPCRNMAAYTAQKVELTGADKEALLHSGFDMCRLGQKDGAKGDKAAFADVIKIHQSKLNALIPGTREYIFEDWLFSFYSAGFTSSTPGNVDDLIGDSKAEAKQPAKASGAAVNGYITQVVSAIQSKFINADLYKGKVCNIRISLDINGVLQSVKSEGGDPALCEEIIGVIKSATFPKMTSPELLPIFQNAPLRIAPQ